MTTYRDGYVEVVLKASSGAALRLRYDDFPAVDAAMDRGAAWWTGADVYGSATRIRLADVSAISQIGPDALTDLDADEAGDRRREDLG